MLSDFSFKSTSLSLTPGPGASTIPQGNVEGTAAGFGTFVGAKSETVSWCSIAHLEPGDTITGWVRDPMRAAGNIVGKPKCFSTSQMEVD